jgi:Cu-Zn family superoxide dismutase
MKKLRSLVWIALALSAVFLIACPATETEAPVETEAPPPPPVEEAPAPVVASAELQSRADVAISGSITLTATEAGVSIVAEVAGVTPGKHGFHIHQVGDCSSEDFKSAGGHFNPATVDHAGPADESHHGGDLGNIEVGEDGTGRLDLVSTVLTLDDGPTSAIGRGVILHEGEDDLTSQPTGAAGSRLGCGVIALASGDDMGDAKEAGDEEAGSEG